MPAIRLDRIALSYNPQAATRNSKLPFSASSTTNNADIELDSGVVPVVLSGSTESPAGKMYFPVGASDRKAFRTSSGKV
jgi:hypothetical protein